MKWPPGRKRLEILIRNEAVCALHAAKRVYPLVKLSQVLGIPISTLSRYVQGETVPNIGTARAILEALLDDKFFRELVARALSKLSWDLNAFFSDPKLSKIVSMYFMKKLLDLLAGTSVNYLITFPGYSSLISSHIALSMDLPVVVLGDHSHSDWFVVKPTIRRGSTAVVSAAVFGKEEGLFIRKLVNDKDIEIVLIESFILYDREQVMQMFSSVPIVSVLP